MNVFQGQLRLAAMLSVLLLTQMVMGCSTTTGSGVAPPTSLEEGETPDVCENAWLPIEGWLDAFPRQVSELTEAQQYLISQIRGNNAAWRAYCGGKVE